MDYGKPLFDQHWDFIKICSYPTHIILGNVKYVSPRMVTIGFLTFSLRSLPSAQNVPFRFLPHCSILLPCTAPSRLPQHTHSITSPNHSLLLRLNSDVPSCIRPPLTSFLSSYSWWWVRLRGGGLFSFFKVSGPPSTPNSTLCITITYRLMFYLPH